jgi:hemin uptake protein HemP
MILNTGSGQVISLLNATANLNRTSTSGLTHLLGPHLEVVIRHHTLITRLRLTATTSMLTKDGR